VLNALGREGDAEADRVEGILGKLAGSRWVLEDAPCQIDMECCGTIAWPPSLSGSVSPTCAIT
jgi:hypothetical protein